jgi:hypothetical protein
MDDRHALKLMVLGVLVHTEIVPITQEQWLARTMAFREKTS